MTQPTLHSLTRPPNPVGRVRRVPAWVTPVAILLGFSILFLVLFGDRIVPAPRVDLARAQAIPADTSKPGTSRVQGSGSLLFQASGWIEPDPLPVKATALIDGVIDTVLVLEGQDVKQGAVLATLVDADTRLALAAAEQNLNTLSAKRETHLAATRTARRNLDASRAAERAALAVQEEAGDHHARLSGLPKGTVPESDVVSARLRLSRETEQRAVSLANMEAAEAELSRMELETKVREAEVAAAEVAVNQAKLAFERTRILSPIDGRVLRLTAAPGQKKMLAMDDPDSSTVAILYQPDKLQVRVDVPLADAARLSVGQSVRLHCSLLPDRVFKGELSRITGEADIQRNTLQAKVRILDPIDILRPEMLCRAEFFGNPSSENTSHETLTLWIPQDAITDRSIWVFDPETRRVTKREVTGSETREGMVRITGGLSPGEQVVLAPRNLRNGMRVSPSLKQP